MSIISSIHKFIPSPTTIVGLATLGAVGYDAHYIGKMQSDLYASEKDAGYTSYFLNNDMYNTSMSKIQDSIKEASFSTELDVTWKRFFNEGIGYIKGFTSKLVCSIVPLALGLTAVFGKGAIKTAGAVGAGIYGAYVFIKNFFGIGTPPGINGMV